MTTLAATLIACRGGPDLPRASVPGPPEADSMAIRRDVEHLAADRLEGRGTGSAGNDSAAAYIASRFAALGLTPAGDDRGATFLQRFTARPAALAHAGLHTEVRSQNVVALLRGRDPMLRHQYVVIGAHYDHLGRSPMSSLDPGAGDAIRNGADDNASGTAAVLELARLFARRPPARSLIFATFSAEELGLLGSQHLVEHFPVPLDSVVAMLNFDMVGRLRDSRLIVYGVATAAELTGIVDSANRASSSPLLLTATGDGFGSSDHSSFYAKNLPVLHFFTNVHEDYHRATDDADRVSAAGEARVVALAERVVREIAERRSRLTFTRVAGAPPRMSASSGSGAWFGSVPDMGAADVRGLRVAGVTPGSPADKAGLRAGDVVVRFGGVDVTDLYTYTDALRSNKPGDVVEVVVARGGDRLTLTATLARRGGG